MLVHNAQYTGASSESLTPGDIHDMVDVHGTSVLSAHDCISGLQASGNFLNPSMSCTRASISGLQASGLPCSNSSMAAHDVTRLLEIVSLQSLQASGLSYSIFPKLAHASPCSLQHTECCTFVTEILRPLQGCIRLGEKQKKSLIGKIHRPAG